jgi:hypothetical protein
VASLILGGPDMDRSSKIGAATRARGLILACMLGLLALALRPGPAHADPVYNTSLASPGVYFGTGNSNSGFTVDTENNVEIGLSAIDRYVGPITPDGDLYDVPLGDAAPPNTGSAWGVTFSINLRDGGGTLTLSGIDAVLTVTDVGTGFTASIPEFLTALADNTCYNGSVDATCTSGSDYGVQNSEPGSLFSAIGDAGFSDQTGDTYEITLDVYGCSDNDCKTNLLVTDSIQIDAIPEPSALVILWTALAGLGLFRYRRRASRAVA